MQSRNAPKVLPALLTKTSFACATWNGALPRPSGWQAGASNHTKHVCCREMREDKPLPSLCGITLVFDAVSFTCRIVH